jgi:hypothetical protein
MAWPRSLMSYESHGLLTERTFCAIHDFQFLLPKILSWFPFQIVLWTFYQYEVIVTQYIRLVIQAIQSFVCKAEAPLIYFPKMGDWKIESLCISWWSLLLAVFLFGVLLFLLIKSIQQRHAGFELDSKTPTTKEPRWGHFRGLAFLLRIRKLSY